MYLKGAKDTLPHKAQLPLALAQPRVLLGTADVCFHVTQDAVLSPTPSGPAPQEKPSQEDHCALFPPEMVALGLTSQTDDLMEDIL